MVLNGAQTTAFFESPDQIGIPHATMVQMQHEDIMVLAGAQTTAFFESPDQMGIPCATMVQMQHERIQSIADLADFDKESLKQLADNLRKPGGRIPDPDPNAVEGATIPTPAFTYGAKSQKRLTVACDLIRYYQTVGRDLTAANIQWNQVTSNFEIQ